MPYVKKKKKKSESNKKKAYFHVSFPESHKKQIFIKRKDKEDTGKVGQRMGWS